MRVTARHAARGHAVRGGAARGTWRRVAALLAAAVASTLVLTAAAVTVSRSGGVPVAATGMWASSSGGSAASDDVTAPGTGAVLDARAAAESEALTESSSQSVSAGLPGLAAGSGATASPVGVPVLLALGPLTQQACPAAATACVDLADHLTWLQSGGQVTYGPVRMEPGPSGQHATPRGTFRVSWKGGPGLVSNVYDEPMPYAVFFAPGGIAFHGGSLTVPSHGCVHLTMANARYYNEHLPIGAEVIVF